MYNNQKRPVSASLGAFIIAAIDRVVNIFLSNQMILPFLSITHNNSLSKIAKAHKLWSNQRLSPSPLQLQSKHGSINMLLKT